MTVDHHQTLDTQADKAAPDILDHGAQGFARNRKRSGKGLVAPGVAIGDRWQQKRAKLVGDPPRHAMRKVRIGRERQMRTVLLDRADSQNGHDSTFDRLGNLRPGGARHIDRPRRHGVSPQVSNPVRCKGAMLAAILCKKHLRLEFVQKPRDCI